MDSVDTVGKTCRDGLLANVESAQISIRPHLSRTVFQDLCLGILTEIIVDLFHLCLLLWREGLVAVQLGEIGGFVGISHCVDVLSQFPT